MPANNHAPASFADGELMTRKAPLIASGADAPATLNEEARSVGVVLATESPVTVYDWQYGGRVQEVLLMSGAVLPPDGRAPLLDSHNSWNIAGQIGSLRNFAVKGKELHAEAHFSSVAEKPFALVKEGHLRDVSVGYIVRKHVFVPEKGSQVIDGQTFNGPVKVVTKWEVKEGSFTPIGADKNAKTRAHASEGENMEEKTMPNVAADQHDQANSGRTENGNAAPVNNTPPPESHEQRAADAPPANAAQADAVQTRAEIADILTLGRRHDCIDLAETAIRSGTSLAAFQGQVLDHLAGQSERHAPGHMPYVAAGEDESRKFRAAASDSLCLRAGDRFAPKELAPGALDLRGFSLRELARECLRREGKAVHGDMDMVGRAFTSTSDFPAILADAAHKSVLAGALEANEVFDQFTGEVTAIDFRKHTGVALEAFSTLELVPESAEYKHGEITDRGVGYEIATYGKVFSISRQAIINDDVNAFTQIPAAMGRAAMRTAGDAVFNLLIGNPQMPDGNALFSAAHGNLASAGAAINAASFKVAVTAMGTQKGKQGEALNIPPAFMILPVSRQDEAYMLLHSMVIGTQAQPNQANPWKGKVQPITDARLDIAGSGAWFLSGLKGWGINTAWLGGNKTPRVEQRLGWSIDGTEFKVSIDFGCYVQDWRALFKNPGA